MQQRWCASPVAALSTGFTACREVNGWTWQPIWTGHNYMPCLAIASSLARGCMPAYFYIYIMHFAITTRFQTTFGIQHLRSGQWGMVHPPTSNTCSKNMFVKLLGPDLQNIYSTQSLSSSAPGLLASGIGSWPTCCSRATRSNATAVKAQQRVQSCLRLCRILQCHEIQGKHSAHTPLHTQGVLVVRGFGLRSRCLLAFRL